MIFLLSLSREQSSEDELMLVEEIDGEVWSERFCSGGGPGKGPGGAQNRTACPGMGVTLQQDRTGPQMGDRLC